MDINIFILCYNEELLLPKTVEHYKRYLPSCKITIYDNESTDNSVQISKDLGCNVISWSSNNSMNEFKQRELKNECWKDIKSGWILMIDMDEWLCVTESDLLNEMQNKVTILDVKGINMIGESQLENLSDIDLHAINKYVDHYPENKNLCFLRDEIHEMNYTIGAHACNPIGNVKYSEKVYINKHMGWLGLQFYIGKMNNRFPRAYEMQQQGMNFHYTDDIEKLTLEYNNQLKLSKIL
jgi:glycosyltransferase involved in cell wall biosynthesis